MQHTLVNNTVLVSDGNTQFTVTELSVHAADLLPNASTGEGETERQSARRHKLPVSVRQHMIILISCVSQKTWVCPTDKRGASLR